MQNSAEFNIDLNSRNNVGETPFHFSCRCGDTVTAEMLVQKSARFNIDLDVKDMNGRTGFHLACFKGRKKIIAMILDKAKSIKLDLEAKDNNGRTGYKLAKSNWNFEDIHDIFKQKIPSLVEYD